MTIKGLWSYITSKAIECLQVLPQDAFKGYYLSIDAMGFCFPYMMSARKTVARAWNVLQSSIDQNAVNVVFYRLFMQNLISLLEKGITPIWVFEFGRHRLKQKTDEKRTLEREAALAEITQLREELNMDAFARKNQTKLERLRSLEANLKVFPSEVKEEILNLLISLGFICVRPKDGVEAERVASILCMQDVAIAVYSPDGDCLAHGAPIQVKEIGEPIFTNGFGTESFVVADRDSLLQIMDVTSDQLTDICICAGCDYNTNMHKVGFIGSLKKVCEYGSVANFPTTMQTECLDYAECIQEFGLDSAQNLLSPECLAYYAIETWADFTKHQINCTGKITNALAACYLEHYEEEFLRKVARVVPAQGYVHYTYTQLGTEDTVMTLHFPEGGIPYIKPEAKKKGSRKAAPVEKEKTNTKVRTLLRNHDDDF